MPKARSLRTFSLMAAFNQLRKELLEEWVACIFG
jgi:hypothetical protein